MEKMKKNISTNPNLPVAQTERTQTPLVFPAFHRKTLKEVADELGKIPREAYVVAMATDGLPLLVNLDDIRYGVLFWGRYHIPSIPKINQFLNKDGYKVNYTAFSSRDCFFMSDEVLAHMSYLGGNPSKNVVFFEDFSVLSHAVEKNMEKTKALQRCLSFKNTFVIGNCSEMTEVVYGGLDGGWKKYFHILTPTTQGDVFMFYQDGKPLYAYAPI